MTVRPSSAPPNPPAGPPRGEPIYPSGRPLNVPADAVQLTLLTPDLFRTEADRTREAEADLELRTPLGVRLPTFEGPLDLLLFLIRRDELDIYDIPIAHITKGYLDMLQVMQTLDLDVAGDFLVMAASLMRLKARMLLPTWPENEDEEDDPRAELVRQLLEYRRFKEAAGHLGRRAEERARRFGRAEPADVEVELPEELAPASQFDLIEAIRDVLSRVGESFFYAVELEDVSMEEKMALVREELGTRGRVLFADLLMRTPRKLHVVVTFMAVLELSRMGELVAAQEAAFRPIWLYPVVEGKVVADSPGEDADAAE